MSALKQKLADVLFWSVLQCHCGAGDFATGKLSLTKMRCVLGTAKVLYYVELEIRSVERGVCPIATSTINERTVPIIMALYCVFFIAHARNGRISTSGLKSDVTIVFLNPDFL